MAKPASSLHSELGGRAPFGHRVPATSDLERGTTKGWFAPVREGDTLSLLLESIRLSPARLPSPRLLCGRQGSFRSITGSWLISKLPSSEEGPPSDERCGLDGAPSWSLRWHLAATGRIVVGGVRLRLSASVCVWVSSHCATSSLSHAERATKSSVDEVAMASFLFSRTFRRWRLGVGGFRSSEPTCALRGEPTCATRGSSSGAASSGACSCSLRQLSVVGVGAKRLVRSGLLPPRGGLLRTALPVTRSGLRYNSAAIRSAKSARRSRKRTKISGHSIFPPISPRGLKYFCASSNPPRAHFSHLVHKYFIHRSVLETQQATASSPDPSRACRLSRTSPWLLAHAAWTSKPDRSTPRERRFRVSRARCRLSTQLPT